MGCTTSLDGSETQQKKNNNEVKGDSPLFQNSKNAQNVSESTQKLSEMDLVRIKVILDYWFDEGQKFDQGYGQGNSQNYHKIILQIRQGFIPVESSRNQVQNLNFNENLIFKSQVLNDENNQQQKETNIIIETDTKQIKDKAQIQIEGISQISTGGTTQQSDQNSNQNQKNIIPNVNIAELTPKSYGLGSQESKKSVDIQLKNNENEDKNLLQIQTNLKIAVKSKQNQKQNSQVQAEPFSLQSPVDNDFEFALKSECKDDNMLQQNDNNEIKKWDRNSKMPPQMMKRWFGRGKNTDKEISLLFKQDLVDVGQAKLNHWQSDKMGKLAIIILCDQFSRNIYRGLAGAFSFDHISLKISKQIINNVQNFNSYALFEKLFIIMPLMHSESEQDCQLCHNVLEHMIETIKKESKPSQQQKEINSSFYSASTVQQQQSDELIKTIELFKRWCLEHLEILQIFQRFPNRNKVLGRENTDEEDLYLRDASSFGQIK